MEHIKEKLSKINPSIWKCDLRSEKDKTDGTKFARPEIHTSCYISLESPSDFLLKLPDNKKNGLNSSEVDILTIFDVNYLPHYLTKLPL